MISSQFLANKCRTLSAVTWLSARFVAGLLLVHPVFGAFSICLAELCLRVEVRARPPDYLVTSLT